MNGNSGRRPLILVLTLVGMFLALAFVLRDDPANTQPGDPRNARETGTRALAQVLRERGVDVDVVTSREALRRTSDSAEPGTVILASRVGSLNTSGLSALFRAAQRADRLFLTEIAPEQLLRLTGSPGASYLPNPRSRTGAGERCGTPDFAGLQIDLVESPVLKTGNNRARRCFAGLLVEVDRIRPTTLIASVAPFSNEHITKADNAALGLGLFGTATSVIWYVPEPEPGVSEGVTLGSLTPDWLIPSLWLSAAAFVLFALVRGRRFGPLATEPLPAVVKSTETVQGHGVAYANGRDRGHVLGVLRTAFERRVGPRLGLSDLDPPQVWAQRIAQVTQRPLASVEETLTAAAANDDDLVLMAQRLDELERHVLDDLATPPQKGQS